MLKKKFKDIGAILGKKEKKKFFLFTMLSLVVAFVETISIGIVPALFSLILDKNIILEKIKFNEYLYLKLSNFLQEINIFIFVSLLIFIYFTIKLLLNIIYIFLESNFFNKLKKSLSIKIFEIYINKNYLFHTTNNPMILGRNISSETSASINYIKGISIIFREIVLITLISMMLLIVNFKSTLIIFLIISIFSIFYYGLVSPVLKKKVKISLFERGEKMKIVNQVLNSIVEIKIYQKTLFFINKFRTSINRELQSVIYSEIVSKLPRHFLEILIISFLSIVLIFFIKNEIEIKTLTSTILLYFFAALRIYPAVNSILIQKLGLIQSKISLKLISEEINKNYDFKNNIQKKEVKNLKLDDYITIESLSFKYPNRNLIFKNINAKIKKNTITGIIGESGSGKSTLVKIIMGLLEPTEGKILNGVKSILEDINGWQNNFGYVSQNFYILDDTILNNIVLGDERFNLESVENALKFVSLDKFVNELPNKIDTIIGPSGKLLSGGELQRIAIARAMHRNSNIIVLDEATNSLDEKTENEIIKKICELKGLKTIFIITHNKKILTNCDTIFSIENKFLKEIF